MTTHVKVLGVLYIALSALGICAALFVGLAFGTASGVVAANADADAAVALPIIGLAGTALTAFLLAISLPGLIAGIGMQFQALGTHHRYRPLGHQPDQHPVWDDPRHLRALGPSK